MYLTKQLSPTIILQLRVVNKVATVREIERLHRRRFKLHQVETSSEQIPAWRVLEWSCLFPIGVIF